ncbi:hypothetical protein AN476_18630 [Phaeobacter sp. 11ANDIMAR09]|nr:hypothetical protein AN476_18630 [Phaeobacter sp. 11ANDIMAR09]
MHAELPSPTGEDAVPTWVHLLPTSAGAVQTHDKRGPYHVAAPEQIIQNSFAEADKLPIDQDHAMDLAAKEGRPAPARGWIVEMQAREDGIWGRVDWTPSGSALLKDRAYSGISPVIAHLAKPTQQIVAIRRASLVNRPNLRGLHSLNQENDTMFQESIAKLLGLKPDASEDDITTALNSRLAEATDEGKGTTALHSQLGEIGEALGCEKDASAGDILTAAQSQGTDKDETIEALQASVKDLSGTVKSLQASTTKTAAETFVDNAISLGHIGVKPARDRFIALHQQDPEGTEELINDLPKLKGELLADIPPGSDVTSDAINAQELAEKAQALVAKKAEAGIDMTITEAVQAVQEEQA